MNIAMEFVRWEDCHGFVDGWRPIEEVGDGLPLEIVTAGFLLRETDTSITLALSVDFGAGGADTKVDGCVTIPKSAVRERRKLTIARKRKSE